MSATIVTGLDPLTRQPLDVHIDGGLITLVTPSRDQTDFFLAPGLVDLQVNGYAGLDLNAQDLTPAIVGSLVDSLLAQGTTTFAPTLITAPEDQLCRSLHTIALARWSYPRVAACIPFVHLEGPHISALDGFRGAHPAEAVRPPSLAEFDRWQQASGSLVGMLTVSPHLDESSAYIAALIARGVHVAIGHTHASPVQISRAIDAGARLATHLGNGIAQQIQRHRNPIWPQLADDRLTATFIADGHHIPAYVLKPMLRAKGLDRAILVSDSVALAGMPPGSYTMPVGGAVELLADGRLCVAGSDLLAGSTVSLASCVSKVVQLTGITLHEALALATANPGRFVPGRGRFVPGARADIIRFRWQDRIVLEDVWLAGEPIDTITSSPAEEARA